MVMTLEKPETKPQVVSFQNRKYFCLHLPTSQIRIGQAHNVADACEKAGWWLDDCFCHYICDPTECPEAELE